MEIHKAMRNSTAISLAISAAILMLLPFYLTLRQVYHQNLAAVETAELTYLSDVTGLGRQGIVAQFQILVDEAERVAQQLSAESLAEPEFGQALLMKEKPSAGAALVYNAEGKLLYGAAVYGPLFRESALAVAGSGKERVSELVNNWGTRLLGVSVPFSAQDGSGVLVLIYRQTALSSLLDELTQDGSGQICIVDPEGEFILQGSREGAKFGDGLDGALQQTIETEKRLTLFDTRDGAKYTAYATALGINDWLVLYTIPEHQVMSELPLGEDWLIMAGVLTVAGIMATFAGLACGAAKSGRRTELLSLKFRLATKQSSRVAFEYDRRTDRLKFISESKYVKLPKPHLSLMELAALVHPADRPAYYQAVTELRGLGTASVNLRLSNFSGSETCRWYQISATRLTEKGEGRALTIGSIEDIDERENERRLLLAKATTDGLTGLMNRAETEKQVNEKLSKLHEEGKSVFALIDLDGFKEINDRFGHDCGDRALVFFANTLRATFRFGDSLGRLGGDEFVVHMTLTADKEVVARRLTELADRLKADIVSPECTVKGLSCSVGCCIARFGDTFESVYRRADEALYKAKLSGKNQFVIED